MKGLAILDFEPEPSHFGQASIVVDQEMMFVSFCVFFVRISDVREKLKNCHDVCPSNHPGPFVMVIFLFFPDF